jgi:hypothetical protein
MINIEIPIYFLGSYYNSKAYFIDEQDLFAIVNPYLTTGNIRNNKWSLWGIYHIPSEEFLFVTFRKKEDAKRWLRTFLSKITDSKKILFTFPGTKLLIADFKKEIDASFIEVYNSRT